MMRIVPKEQEFSDNGRMVYSLVEAEHYPLFAAAFMGEMTPEPSGPEL